LSNFTGVDAFKFSPPMKLLLRTFALVFVLARAVAQQEPAVVVPEGFQRVDLDVDGVKRMAIVRVPATAKDKPAPLLFGFHGHGGRMAGAARSFHLQDLWPEAIVVYMQGLNTPGRLTDPEGKKPGWQHGVGAEGDRDLKFFDAMLAKLKADYRVDEKRIYSMGHSNGGGFTYLLWAERGDVFAAMGPSGSAAAESFPKLKPKPAIHVAGAKDPLVKFEWQRATMDKLLKLNGCDAEGTGWGENSKLYASKTGTPLVLFIHPGGHEYPAGAPEQIVKFFKDHPGK
jgi:polyhydroxybutyrate depolymerase